MPPGCHRERRVYSSLATVVRVGDLVPSAEPTGIAYRADVTLEGEIRRALAAPLSGPVTARLEATGPRRVYRLEQVPPSLRTWGRSAIDRPALIGGKTVKQWPIMVDLGKEPLPLLPVGPSEKPDPVTMFVVHAAPTPEAFDVETRPFVMPEGAVLDFGIGLHAPAARGPGVVEARVVVRDDAEEKEVWRAEVSGTDVGWQDARADLGPFAGRTVRLRFTSRGRGSPQLGLLALFAEPRVLAPRTTYAPALNVVLISMDTLRAQSVSAYGAERAETPTLDRLAGDGALFENAFSTAAYTLPGHMSMISGLQLRTHGAVTLVTALAAERRTLPEILQSAGYATALASSNSWLTPHLGFRRGIDAYSEVLSTFAPPPQGLPCEAFTKGLEWMRAHRNEPFYLFLHNYQVHRPYLAPPPYVTRFGPPPYTGPVEGDYLLYRYEQEVGYADDQLRAFLEGLDALGLSDRTLVVVTADHGEAFGEHGFLEHTRDSHDETARVPLVMRLPGAIPAGRRIAEPVSLTDILPTVLDLVGLPPLPATDGMSLLPLLVGAADRLPRDGVFTESGSEGIFNWFDITAIRSRTHSCLRNVRLGVTECFDARVDPWERLTPLSPEAMASQAHATLAALERFVGSRPPLVPRWTVVTGAEEPKGPVEVDPDRQRELRALGYLE